MTFWTEVIITAAISAVVAVSTTLLTAALQAYKWKSGELPKAKADKDSVITDTSLDLVNGIRAELTVMQLEIQKLRSENADLRLKLAELEDVKDWAERLVHQVRSLGAEPVKMHARIK